MKKIITFSLALSALIFTASAQEQREIKKERRNNTEGREGMRENNRSLMADLNLTEAQKTQMKSNRESFKNQMEQLKALNLPEAQYNERRKALFLAQKAKMESVLTAEQKAKMMEGRKENKGKEGKFKKDKSGKHFDKMKEKLGLSDDQATRLLAQHDALKTRKEAIKNDRSLSKDARKAQMMALKNEAKEQRKSILTADQLKKMDEFKKEHKDKNSRKARK